MRVFAILLLLCMPALAISHGQAATVEQNGQPFSIAVSARNTSFKAGEPIAIRVRLTNTSEHELNASASWERGVDMDYEYDIRDGSGDLYERKERTGSISDTTKIRSLKPGESVEDGTLVSEAYDMSRPGQYVVQLSRRINGNPGDDVVKSNTIIITVVASGPSADAPE